MAHQTLDLAAQQAQLIARYQQLPPREQTLVQMLSILYAPVSKPKLLNCLNLYSIDETSLTGQQLQALLDPLLAQNLVQAQGGKGVCCHPLVVEVATRATLRNGAFEDMVSVVRHQLPIKRAEWNRQLRFFNSQEQFLREVRIALYSQDLPLLYELFDHYYRTSFVPVRLTPAVIFAQICQNPFDRDWFITLKSTPELYETALSNICITSLMALTPADEAFTLLSADLRDNSSASNSMGCVWIEQLLMRGQLPEAETAITNLQRPNPERALLYQSWLNFLQGNYDQTISFGELALKQLKARSGKRKIYFDTIGGLFLVLALLHTGVPARMREAEQYAQLVSNQQYRHWLSQIYACLGSLIQFNLGNQTAKNELSALEVTALATGFSLQTLIEALCLYWVDFQTAKARLPKLLRSFYQAATAAGYRWFALEAAELLHHLDPTSAEGQQAEVLRQATGIRPLTALIRPKEPWEISLTALVKLNPTKAAAAPTPTASNYRLAWFLRVYSSSTWMLEAKEQKITTKGDWSRGRIIALRRLKKEQSSFSYLTPQDIEICSHLTPEAGSYGYDNYRFLESALLALVGHPLVFWSDSPTTRVDVLKGEPALLVQRAKAGELRISLTPEASPKQKLVLVKETPTRLKLIELNGDYHRIAQIIGPKNQLKVPDSAKDQVLEAISAVAGLVTVQSDIGGGVADAEAVAAHPQPHIHLLPAGTGLKVTILTRPFGDHGPYYSPGSGGEMVVAEIDGRRLQTHRDLKQEKQLARAVVKACPTLQLLDSDGGEWLIPDAEPCLELLLELQTLDDQTVVEWPEGETLKLLKQVGLSDFNLKIKRQRDWFAASGELQISENQVLDMQRLLELIDQTPGRFMRLEDGQFLALTEEFRRRLAEMQAFAERRGKGLQFHPLAALTLADWIDEVGQLQTDQHWQAHLERLEAAKSFQPQLPSTLQAELRDYQLDGFTWLARLAHWGVGACLADDMGLGKTLQALALILTRAPQGPSLVIAPTSVGMNWLSEAEKFAPTLRPVQFGSGDRQALLDNLQPFDLLVCSYGLLQQDEVAAMLAQIPWQTIVLDEAQAIKNASTKRSKAAMQLQGGFKLITTGTPIENHLGELWNLFRFINPGLLGSEDRFNQTFANPIERFQDRQARNRLKQLIQPYILRRTKTQVLEELPARTDIILQVQLSAPEMAFYEALRQEALVKLADPEAHGLSKPLLVLAEIMRLRRACCNTRLVKPEVPLPSAKLEAFGEIMEDLLANHHKALVFSQFVDHLAILREFLEGQQIAYQYLDGSTPAKERKKRVDAFQAGEGDVFLISLKAGGTGLNLTAADYVIHMDPWWNPAVEDQASDRAHRIGQQRPVTIYRLVAKNTIEEKIVDLHQQKRDLADSLLEGSDISGKMSTEDLLRLIATGE